MQEAENPRGQEIHLLECNVDDATGETLGFVLERLLATGALDAWFTPIYMKKNRPGVMVSVLCRPEDAARLRELLLRETPTLGVRWHVMQREVAERRVDQVQTPWGIVRRKLKLLDGQVVSIKPEYEDCARLARDCNVPLSQVIEAARQAQPDDLDA